MFAPLYTHNRRRIDHRFGVNNQWRSYKRPMPEWRTEGKYHLKSTYHNTLDIIWFCRSRNGISDELRTRVDANNWQWCDQWQLSVCEFYETRILTYSENVGGNMFREFFDQFLGRCITLTVSVNIMRNIIARYFSITLNIIDPDFVVTNHWGLNLPNRYFVEVHYTCGAVWWSTRHWVVPLTSFYRLWNPLLSPQDDWIHGNPNSFIHEQGKI